MRPPLAAVSPPRAGPGADPLPARDATPTASSRLRTLYMSDDARDLVAIVGERYKEDIARFGYVFPANSSAPTMRT